jgi:DNA mismatch repair protein MSH2
LVNRSSDSREVFDKIVLEPLSSCLPKLDRFTAMVDKMLDLESIADGVFQIKSCVDEDLGTIKEQIDDIKAKINSDSSKEAKTFGLDQRSLKLENSAQLGYYYRVTLKDEKNLRYMNQKAI